MSNFLIGTVSNVSGNKTKRIQRTILYQFKKYTKKINKSQYIQAHDEHNIANTGDIVKIKKCRPLSKSKHHFICQVIKKNPYSNIDTKDKKNII